MKNTLKTKVLKGVLFAGMVLSLAGCDENRKGSFTDARDGKTYKTVKIGSQTWMAENLNYAYKPDTLSFCYDNSADSCAKYGRLYTWAAAMEACPMGWHLPSNAEWDELGKFVAKSLFGSKTDSVGYALKSASGWKRYDGEPGNGSDAFGFGALPAGYRFIDGETFYFVFERAHFWSATERDARLAYYRGLGHIGARLYTDDDFIEISALSVRCVEDS